MDYARLDQRFRMSAEELAAIVTEYQEHGKVFDSSQDGLDHYRQWVPNSDLHTCRFMVVEQMVYKFYRCNASYDRKSDQWHYSAPLQFTIMKFEVPQLAR